MASDGEITLGSIWSAIWRGKWIVVAVTVVAGLVAFALTFTQDTTYTATSKVYLGQATTMVGNLASTPGTNPLTAAVVLNGDDVVGAVAKATGMTPSAVRSHTDINVPRAPGAAANNQPAIASLAASMPSRDEAIRLSNAYADATLTSASTGYDAVRTTLQTQVRRMRAEEIRLQALARRAPDPATLNQLTDVREVLTLSELQLARAEQIEAPSIVTLARSAASSTSTSNRAREAITGAIIGFLIGIVIALATSGGIRRAAGPA